jgi:flagellar biosynthesis protein FlhB
MSEEKTEKPTPKKLQDARKKGEVFKSNDVTSTAIFIALLIGLSLGATMLLERFRHYLVDSFIVVGTPKIANESLIIVIESATRTFAVIAFPVLMIAMCTAIFSKHLQIRGVFSMDPITPKPERINPGTNLKNLFSTRNAFNAVKTLIKVAITGAIIYYAIRYSLPAVMQLSSATPTESLTVLGSALRFMCVSCVVLYILMAAADYGHEYYEYMKQQKMSVDEVRREFKEMEGDPHIKWQRKALHRELSEDMMVKRVRNAQLLITNPTHFAIALRTDASGGGGVPQVIAKGHDGLAQRMKREAALCNIPVIEDKSLARRLYKEVRLNGFIGSEFFAEMAVVFSRLSLSKKRSGKSVTPI